MHRRLAVPPDPPPGVLVHRASPGARPPALALVLAGLLAGAGACGGGGSGGGSGSGEGAGVGAPLLGEADGFHLADLGTVRLEERARAYGLDLAASPELVFALPADAVSAAILTDFGATGGEGIIAGLASPSGRDLTPGADLEGYLAGPLRPRPDTGANSVVLPVSPGTRPEAGTYRFRLLGDGRGDAEVPVRVAVRTGPADGRTLQVHVVVHTFADLFDAELEGAIAFFRDVLAAGGIEVGEVEVTAGAGGVADAVVTSLDPGSAVESLFATPVPPDAGLVVWLVPDVDLEGAGSVLGVSPGIPGSLAFPRPTDGGVIVSVAAHLRQTAAGVVVDAAELGTTMAHEAGHWLGLHHTSEAGGDAFDPLGDTPECDAGRDRDGNGDVDPFECLGAGARNLMFWTGTRNTVLTPEQAEVLRRSPVVTP